MKTPESTILKELEDRVANAAIYEAAIRFADLLDWQQKARPLMKLAADQLEQWNGYAPTCKHDDCKDICLVVAELVAELRKEAE